MIYLHVDCDSDVLRRRSSHA